MIRPKRKTGAVSPNGNRRGEFDVIASVLAPLAEGDARALGLSDDAAILPQRDGIDTVVSTDTLVAGIHFLEHEDPDIIARRLLRVNLSDIAAMGAAPVGYFLNLTLSPDIDDIWIEKFAAGLASDQKTFGIGLWGGDTTKTTGSLTVSVTMIGEVPSGTAVRRSTAAAGDRVFVSGTIGDAGLGLERLVEGASAGDALVRRYQVPDPRVALGIALRDVVSAMADVSDGLAADLGHICTASGLSATINAENVPLSSEARSELAGGRTDIAGLMTSGDDYELVFAVSPDRVPDILAAAEEAAVAVTEIGAIDGTGQGVRVLDMKGKPIPFESAGYRHF